MPGLGSCRTVQAWRRGKLRGRDDGQDGVDRRVKWVREWRAPGS